MTPAERIIVEAFGFIVIDLPPLGALAYALKKSRKERREAELRMWRRIAANLGFLAVAAQTGVLLSIWIWPEFTRMPLLSNWAH